MKREFLLFAFALGILLSGCAGENGNAVEEGSSPGAGGAENEAPALKEGEPSRKIEVIHFHGTRQCYSCVTVGQYAEETINTYFSKEVEEGELSFAHINVELPENREKALQYGATGSSIWIGTYTENGFRKEENILVWYKIGDMEEYMRYFKGVLERKLDVM